MTDNLSGSGLQIAKVPPMVVLDVAMTASLATVALSFSQWTSEMLIMLILFAFFLIGSLFCLIRSAIPRTKIANSVIYFRGILSMKQEEYKCTIKNISEEIYLHDLIDQSYQNAQIAHEKYHYIWPAMAATMAAIIPWAVTFFLFLTHDVPC